MKHLLLTTIAVVVLVGCGGPSVDIHQAAREGSIEAVKQHITTGTDVNAKYKDGWTPLHMAAKGGHREIVDLLIAKGADINATAGAGGDGEGWTPLHEAATYGHKEIAELLIAGGADVNAKDNLTSTALHWAAGGGHKEVVELLIAEGADVNAMKKRSGSPTPLDMAIQQKKTETANLLRKHGGKTGDWFKAGESIHIAAKAGHIEAVNKHLAAGTDVNAKDGGFGDPTTPLHLAAWKSRKEMVELLIAKGADVNAKTNDDGFTPLEMADDKEITNLLRKHGGKTGEELKAEGK